jgi:hypothetical protein
VSDRTSFLGVPETGWTALSSMGVFCGLATLIFGVFEYTSSLEEERAERTLKLLKEWREDGYRDNFQALAGFTTKVIEENLTPGELDFLQNNPDRQGAVAEKVSTTVLANNPEAEEALDEVVYFFNLLGLCVKAEMCSEATARGFFENTLQDFHFMFAAPIEDRREALPDYGSGMLDLLKRFQSSA